MRPAVKRALLDCAGLACCSLPPAIVAIQYFPLWRETVGLPAVAGGSLATIAIIALITVGRYVKVRLSSPSPVMIFGALYVLFLLVEKVISGLVVITFWGFLGSAAGALFFILSDKYKNK